MVVHLLVGLRLTCVSGGLVQSSTWSAVLDDWPLDNQQHDAALPHGIPVACEDQIPGRKCCCEARSSRWRWALTVRSLGQGHFFLFDAGSSNGTMLFLSKPLELDWNKTMHVKIGRTILTLKSKKKWKWSGVTDDGGADSDGEAVTSPRLSGLGTPRDAGDLTPRMHFANSFSSSTPRRPGLNRFESDGALSDPSAELLSSPFRGQFAGASGFTVPDGTTPPEDDSAHYPTTSQGFAEHPDVPETFNLSEIDDDNRDSTFNARHDGGDPSSSATSPTFRPYLPGNLRSSFPDSTSPSAFGLLQGRVADLPRIRNELRQRREHALYDLVESLARVDTTAAVASSSTSSSAVPAAESSSTAAPTHFPDQQVDKE